MSMGLHEIQSMIISAEKQAGELILHAHGIIAENKTDARNMVTEYDRRVQELLVGVFHEKLPEAHFFCEENDRQESLSVEHSFIIDPIDGTANFVHGFHHSSISVAYARYGKVIAGAVYNPYMDEMFSAVEHEGATLNGRPVHVTDDGLSASIACIGTSPYYQDLEGETFRMMRFLFDRTLDLRREGSAALDLCSVASGRAGIYTEELLSYWDYAAGAFIAREAGAVTVTPDGSPLPADGSKAGILAGAPKAVEEFLRDYAKNC